MSEITLALESNSYVKRALVAGFTKEQAEFQAEEFSNFVETNIATKDDVKIIHQSIDMLKKDIEIMIQKQTIRFGTMLAIAISILPIVIKIFH